MARAQGRRSDGSVEVAGVRLTSPDRVVFPEPGVTKRELAEYYEAVGEVLLRRAAGRPLALVRCPEGMAGDCFYQKHPGDSFGVDVPRVEVVEKEGPDVYVYATQVAHLVSLVQVGVVEVNTWGSTVERLEQPDRLVFDLDPSPGVPFGFTKQTAGGLRELLARLGLTPFLRATGGKGLHVVAPLTPEAGWDEVSSFAETVAAALVAADPARLTTDLPKERRQGKVFVDYLRNGRGATAIADYSARARPGAPVAVPLRWEELPALETSAAYDVRRTRRRLAALGGDPWEGYEGAAVPLGRAVAALATELEAAAEEA